MTTWQEKLRQHPYILSGDRLEFKSEELAKRIRGETKQKLTEKYSLEINVKNDTVIFKGPTEIQISEIISELLEVPRLTISIIRGAQQTQVLRSPPDPVHIGDEEDEYIDPVFGLLEPRIPHLSLKTLDAPPIYSIVPPDTEIESVHLIERPHKLEILSDREGLEKIKGLIAGILFIDPHIDFDRVRFCPE